MAISINGFAWEEQNRNVDRGIDLRSTEDMRDAKLLSVGLEVSRLSHPAARFANSACASSGKSHALATSHANLRRRVNVLREKPQE